MGALRGHAIRRPLPPDLRKNLKAELRPLAAKHADRVAVARQLRASRIEDAKGLCNVEIGILEREYAEARKATIAGFEAQAAKRRVAEFSAAQETT